MTKTRLILWDWNGTLLNDIEACISSMNIILENHNILTCLRSKGNGSTYPISHNKYLNIADHGLAGILPIKSP
jgi:beta-phosphoglucomutase-like phosphatase (HAD superfamily)